MRSGLHLVAYLALLLMTMGCEDWNLPRIDHFSVVMVKVEETADSLVVSSRIEGLELETVDEYGHVWGIAGGELPTIDINLGQDNFELLSPSEATEPFQSRINKLALQPKARYVFRAYARIDDRFCYSEAVLSYQSVPLVIQSGPVEYESGTAATVEGQVFLQHPGLRVLDYGHCWSASSADPRPGIDPCTRFGELIAQERRFTSEIGGLQDGQSYTVVPYAILEIGENETDTCFGEPVFFEAMLRQFWRPLKTLEGMVAREGAATFTFGDSLACIAGGISRNEQDELRFLNDCWCYSRANGWRPAANLPEPLAYAVSFTLGRRAFVGTGLRLESAGGHPDTVVSATFFAYDLTQDNWEPATALPEPRLFATGFTLNGEGIVAGGLDNVENARADSWRFEDNGAMGSWQPSQPLDTPRYGMITFDIGDSVYLGSGFTKTGAPSEEVWRIGGSDTVRLSPARGFAIGFSDQSGQGFAAMGIDPPFNVLKDVQVFDPTRAEWQVLTEFPVEGRIFATGFYLQGQLFFGLGATPDGVTSDDFWVYSP